MAITDILMTRPPRSGLMLSVLDGLHRGADAPIAGQVCTVGSGTHCNIVLTDDGIAPDHVRLRFHGRQVAVDALGGDVGIDGRAPVRQGHGCRIPLPAVLRVGATRLRLHHPAASAGVNRGILLGGAALVALLFGVMFTSNSTGIGRADGHDRADPVAVPVAQPVPSGPRVADELRARLAGSGLGPLAVTADDHHLEVRGDLADADMAAWQDVQRWFDRTYGDRYVLTGHVVPRPAVAPPEFAFQAVWFGADPYVVDARGERRYPGAALQDGWMLKSIAAGRITVSHGEAEFHLTL